MEPKFTAGPWHPGAGNGTGCVFADQGRMRLENGRTTLLPIANCEMGWDDETDEANAFLVATAPDLFYALIQAVEASGFSVSGPTDIRAAEDGEPAWVCNARAVISNATKGATS